MSVVMESSALIESFITRATAVSAEVERAASPALALARVLRILEAEGVSDAPGAGAVWAASAMADAEEQAALEASVRGLTFHVTRENATEALVGISQMDWALANTGTVVQVADEVEQRLVSTLPLLHIALVSSAALLPDLPSLLEKVDPHKAAYLAFITGPSRTADIERVLTIGVHGPARLIVILVDGMEVAA
jgi:L-lactate dehydrogenase complex protein LldG